LAGAIAIALIAVTPAVAADQPVLPFLPQLDQTAAPAPAFAPFGEWDKFAEWRGFTDWRGFYVGGLVSYSDVGADFSNATQAPIAQSLQQTALQAQFAPSTLQVLGSAFHGNTGFGGFVGYNSEYLGPYGKVVLGVEADYEHAMVSLVAPNTPIARVDTLSSGTVDAVSITGSGTLSNLDFGTLRGRAGWDFNGILPYMFAGLAVGTANLNISETTTVVQNFGLPSATTLVFPGTAGRNGEWLWGYAVGAGVDVALTNHFFLRAEYEFVQFNEVANTAIDINSVHVGAAFKF
jgi:outer membrane immunogenic protein